VSSFYLLKNETTIKENIRKTREVEPSKAMSNFTLKVQGQFTFAMLVYRIQSNEAETKTPLAGGFGFASYSGNTKPALGFVFG